MRKLLAAITLALASGAHAEFVSGEHLYQSMSSTIATERGVAVGYVVGVADTLAGTHICLPSAVNPKQLATLVYQWLDSNPEYRHNSGDRVVAAVLGQAWPCVKGKKSDV